MKKRILLVEDHEATVEVMRTELELLGYNVITATDGDKAVEIAASGCPDLIVMDMAMPKMDGFQAASEIRKNPKTQDIPILAATAKAMTGDREKCLAAGCDAYLAKPFTYKELGSHIDALLKQKSPPQVQRHEDC